MSSRKKLTGSRGSIVAHRQIKRINAVRDVVFNLINRRGGDIRKITLENARSVLGNITEQEFHAARAFLLERNVFPSSGITVGPPKKAAVVGLLKGLTHVSPKWDTVARNTLAKKGIQVSLQYITYIRSQLKIPVKK